MISITHLTDEGHKKIVDLLIEIEEILKADNITYAQNITKGICNITINFDIGKDFITQTCFMTLE